MKPIKIHLIRSLAQLCALTVMLLGLQGMAQAEDPEDRINGMEVELAGKEKLRISHCCREYNPLYGMFVTFTEGKWEAKETSDANAPVMYEGTYKIKDDDRYDMKISDMEYFTHQIESMVDKSGMDLDVTKYKLRLRLKEKENGTLARIKGNFRLSMINDSHRDHRGYRGYKGHRGHRGHRDHRGHRGVYKMRARGLLHKSEPSTPVRAPSTLRDPVFIL